MINAYTFNNKKYKHTRTSRNDSIRIAKIIELTGSDKKVLDIGCGGGEIGSLLINNGNEVYGIDISSSCVKEAKSNGLVTKQCDIESEAIPFKTKFDVIIAGEIIEHIFDTEGFLKKLQARLKKNGVIIITTPNIATLGRRLLLLFGKNPHLEPSANINYAGHIRYFTKDLLITLLEETGLSVEVFTSDVVNFNASGSLRSKFLAKFFPTMGRQLIIKCARS